jgi:hypothetical protein
LLNLQPKPNSTTVSVGLYFLNESSDANARPAQELSILVEAVVTKNQSIVVGKVYEDDEVNFQHLSVDWCVLFKLELHCFSPLAHRSVVDFGFGSEGSELLSSALRRWSRCRTLEIVCVDMLIGVDPLCPLIGS